MNRCVGGKPIVVKKVKKDTINSWGIKKKKEVKHASLFFLTYFSYREEESWVEYSMTEGLEFGRWQFIFFLLLVPKHMRNKSGILGIITVASRGATRMYGLFLRHNDSDLPVYKGFAAPKRRTIQRCMWSGLVFYLGTICSLLQTTSLYIR